MALNLNSLSLPDLNDAADVGEDEGFGQTSTHDGGVIDLNVSPALEGAEVVPDLNEAEDPFELNVHWGYDGIVDEEINEAQAMNFPQENAWFSPDLNEDIGPFEHNEDQQHQVNDGSLSQNEPLQQTGEARRNRRKELSNQERDDIYKALLASSNNGKKKKDSSRLVANRFNCSMRTVQRIWDRAQGCIEAGTTVDVHSKKPENCGKKKIQADFSPLADIPLNERGTIRAVAEKMGMAKSTVYKRFKEGDLRRHSNCLKPLLRESNQKDRLTWCVSMLDEDSLSTEPKFKYWDNVIHVDEKWFNMTRKCRTIYLLPSEEELYRRVQNTNSIGKNMFLAAVTHSCFDIEEKKRRRSDPSLHNQINDVAAIVSRQRKRKCDPDPDPVAADFSLDLQKPGISSGMPLEEEEKPKSESDGLEDYWKAMALAVESTKLNAADETGNKKDVANEKVEDNDCNHDIRIHEDLGHVCRICGKIVRRAESIFDYHWKKSSRRRTNFYEGHSKKDDQIDCGPVKLSEDFIVGDIAVHPRHAKEMRSHQLEGFNFLVKNLFADWPVGCILAHAPGSGKTFMIISFIQSFLARYPSARPLIVLPKFIVSHWKDEFQRWQIQDIPLYDFYSVKAEKRVEQLEVLKSWESKMSILFLGYTQFSRIVSGDRGGNAAAACRDRLLKVPNLLILDEGHKPRNEDTNVLETLKRVETPRKVVLSGTLFQNHVHEVFTILDLVRPKFLKMESSRSGVRRIMSQVEISDRLSKVFAESAFCESVEKTLLSDANINRKAHVIRGLRELTKDVLHYYKGDMLDELPGIVDFSVFLSFSPKQKDIVHKLGAYGKLKRDAVGAALYVHPCLKEISEVNAEDRSNDSLIERSIDDMLDSINFRDGVKARFFMNILSLAESAGEKLLAFSQYKLPMKFLERLLVKLKGWHVGKEIFVISGDARPEDRDLAKDQFNSSTDAKVLFGSIKACGEGISLVGASRIVILDVCLNPSVTRQAIGRAFRPGQGKKVFVYRLVAAESPEEKSHETAFKKEVIPKLWFEWGEHCTTGDFKLDQIDVDDCGDELLDNKAMRQDIKALYKRKQDS